MQGRNMRRDFIAIPTIFRIRIEPLWGERRHYIVACLQPMTTQIKPPDAQVPSTPRLRVSSE
jgi:hypothetical protein